MQQHELGNWTDVYISATVRSLWRRCGRPHPQEHIAPEHSWMHQQWRALLQTNMGADALRVYRSVSGSEVCVTGVQTRSSARSQVGEFVCGDRYFGVREAPLHTRISTSLRLTASGEVACWVDHHAQKHGLPVSTSHLAQPASVVHHHDFFV